MTFYDIGAGLLWGDAVIWGSMTAVGIVDHLAYPPLQIRKQVEPVEAKVSVLIPARNEENNIERCVRSVMAQRHRNLEIIITNDRSEDRTEEIVRSLAAEDDRIRLLQGQELPEGWVGKGWAVFQAHQQACGSWVLLLDADTELAPEAVDTALAYAHAEQIDFLNPTPQFVNRTFWEKTLQPVLWGLVMTRFPMLWVNWPFLKENMAFGPFLLIRKSVYDAVEGHRHVCHDILEDVALSRLIKGRGYKTRLINGRHLFRIRMYDSFSALLEGWIKTAYGAMNYNLLLMTVAFLGLFYMALVPFIALAVGLVFPATGWAAAGLAAVLALYARRITDGYRFRFGLVSLLMHPVAMVVVQYMQAAAVWRFYFGELTWKGRSYQPRLEMQRRREEESHHA